MINEICFAICLAVCMVGTYLSYRLFGKYGLFAWIALSMVMGNVGSLGMADLFGMPTTLGCAIFGTVYLATDILNEIYGEGMAKKAVWCGFVILLFFTVISQTLLWFTPSADDFAHDSFEVIFGMVPRICLGSIAAYVFGNLLDVKIYTWLKEKHGDSKMWLRNNFATMTVQLLDNFVLLGIAYGGVLPWETILMMSVTAWIIEVIVALCDTPFLYLAKKTGTMTED